MPLALGLVETKGLVAAIEAADAMAKASSVRLIGSERINPALITIKVVGDVAAVKASVEAGAAAAARVGQVISVHIIPSPDIQLADIFPEIIQNEILSSSSDKAIDDLIAKEILIEEISPSNDNGETETEFVAAPYILEDLVDIVEVSDIIEPDSELIELEDELTQSAGDEKDGSDNINDAYITEDEVPSADVPQDEIPIPIEEYIDGQSELESVEDEIEEPDDIVFEEQEYNYLEDDTYQSDIPNPEVVVEYDEITYRPEPESSGSSLDDNTDETAELPVDEELHQTFVDVFAVEPEHSVDEFIPDDNYSFEDLFAQAERIEKEKGQKKKSNPTIPKDVVSDIPEIIKEVPVSEPVINTDLLTDTHADFPVELVLSVIDVQDAAEETQDSGTTPETDHELEELKNKPLETMNVHQLRRLARSTASFPIQGREISKANRQELLYYFNALS